MWPEIMVNFVLSLVGYGAVVKIVPKLKEMFLKANISGTDLNKLEKHTIPEATGVITSCIFLIIMFIFIPFPFGKHLLHKEWDFPHEEVSLSNQSGVNTF